MDAACPTFQKRAHPDQIIAAFFSYLIINWLHDVDKKVVNAEGASVTFLHPGAHRCEQYVTRKNDFKLPKRRVKKSRGKMSSAQSSRGSLGSRGTDRQTPVTPASKVA